MRHCRSLTNPAIRNGVRVNDSDIPGREGSIGPFPDQYAEPHVYARCIDSGAGNCVCGYAPRDQIHVQLAPGVDDPDHVTDAEIRFLGKAVAPEQRYLLSLAYQAGPDRRIMRGADGGRDFFTAAELEKAAWSFLPGGAMVGLFHGPEDTVGHFTVVESYIYRGPDWDVGDGIVIKAGDWLIGGIADEIAWDLYKRGRITGMSPQGVAKRRRAA